MTKVRFWVYIINIILMIFLGFKYINTSVVSSIIEFVLAGFWTLMFVLDLRNKK